MVILKLNKFVIFLLFICFSCSKVDKQKCNTYVNEGYSLNIRFIKFKNIEVDSIHCFVQNKSIEKSNIKKFGKNSVEFILQKSTLLTDTVRFEYKGKVYKLYDFKNEIVRDMNGETRKKEDFCILSFYRINNFYDDEAKGEIVIDGSASY